MCIREFPDSRSQLRAGVAIRQAPQMVEEAKIETGEHGSVPTGDGWFVLNARDARWYHVEGRGAFCDLEGEQDFPQVGINIQVFAPGEAMAMYHWEADQENFLVVAGEALLIVEGEERPLRQWDFVHCPPQTKHTIVGAGNGPCVVVAVGARQHQDGPDWGGYTVDDVALRHEAGVERETTIPDEAYAAIRARHGAREPTSYRDGWLP
ncbi:MAG TPA: cupin domain-containing protein [Gaiellaceae bacterium]|nr:cupin domain-containing protein [Gaiellaceae bacterium]